MRTLKVSLMVAFTFCSLFLNNISMAAQTIEVSGDITVNTTWTTDTVKITGNLIVADGVTLSIEPGTCVKFYGHYSLTIKGTLLAIGTDTDSIWFTIHDTTGFSTLNSPQGGWNGIIFNNSSDNNGANGSMNDNDTSKIQFCHVEYAKGINFAFGEGGAIRVLQFSRLIISHSVFLNNSTAYVGSAISCFRGSNILISRNYFCENYASRGGAIGSIEADPVIQLNTIIHNSCWPDGEGNGGGIFCETGKPIIEQNTIKYNSAKWGAGIACFVSNPLIKGNIITYNSGYDNNSRGGGISLRDESSAILINNIITNNFAGSGAGVYFTVSHPYLFNNLIANNTAKNDGGGISLDYSNPHLFNNTVVNNHCDAPGGGLSCTESNPFIVNTILWGNKSGIEGNQVKIQDSYSTPEFYYCAIQDSTSEISGYKEWMPFGNNLFKKPGFKDPSDGTGIAFNGSTANWRLEDYSPCINAGSPNSADFGISGTDLDNNKRVRHHNIDIGAYEVHILSITVSDTVKKDTAWIADTVYVDSDIIIDDGKTLKIVPGARIEFKGHYKIKVMGTLLAVGTQNDMIVFTVSDTAGFSDMDTTLGGWNSITFDNSSYGAGGMMRDNDTSRLIYCKMDYSKNTEASSDYSGGAITILYFNRIIIDNCLIINNKVKYRGGGIYGYKTNAIIKNNTLKNNYAGLDGGGIYLRFSDPLIKNNEFSYNVSDRNGGAIYLINSNPLVEGNYITYNQTNERGGGIMSENASPVIRANFISNNSVQSWGGGGISLYGMSPVVINNIIVNNYAVVGGGIFYNTLDTSYLINNTIAYNKALFGGAIGISSASPHCFNNIMWGNESEFGTQITIESSICEPAFINCNIQNGLSDIKISWGGSFNGIYQNNLDAFPDFKSPSIGAGVEYIGLQADWSLYPTSPCVNRGTLLIPGFSLPGYDYLNHTRINHIKVDMGAIENQDGLPEITLQPDNLIRCAGDSAELVVSSGNKTLFQWQKNGIDIPDAISSKLQYDSVTLHDEGNYQCIISNAYGQVNSNQVYLIVKKAPEILIEPRNQWLGKNESFTLRTYIDGTSPLSYQWQKDEINISGTNTPEYVISDPDFNDEGDYTCIISNSCGEVSTTPATLYLAPQICMVTVDESTGDNLIVWEKNSIAPINQYNVYRESNYAGIFDLLATVPYDDLSVILDETADPTSRAYLYKITAVDTSGFETDIDLCNTHKTIHLLVTANPETKATQLDWDRYVGFDYGTYVIYRSDTTYDFSELNQMSSSTSTWADPDPGAKTNYYRISALRPDPCFPTGNASKKYDSGPYSHAMSNVEYNRLQVGIEQWRVEKLVVRPNPFNESTTIMFKNPEGSSYALYITDLSGKICRIVNDINTSEYIMERKGLESGIYFLELRGPRTYRSKIILE